MTNLMKPINNGLDEQGYIVNHCSVAYIQPAFRPSVDHVVSCLRDTFAGKIHSLYLYGSVARGTAVEFESDIDLSIVFTKPLDLETERKLQATKLKLEQELTIFSKIDFDPGHLEAILSPNELHHWQFWLKHCCCCVSGDDLSLKFSRLKPNRKIGSALNGDLSSFITQACDELNESNQKYIGRMLAKKILRSAYTLIAEKDNSWHVEIKWCVKAVLRHYSKESQCVELALRMIEGQPYAIEDIQQLANGWGRRVASQFKVEEY
ncbi:nucleotidyltransferase domain-containing protein [Vibrio sp.]|uniref:nucleotidyltransferase domain-containing protein n=1 Tax=Vibrio sp. TaxID=678 RepID=UPI00257C5280|nr:nucleotidyltransferase domain-containing protein [Vibrio sp.]